MNLKIFRKLCGDRALQNVVIVTNMWRRVVPRAGEAREAELMRGDNFFKPIFEKGARMARNEDTVTSARKIIHLVLNNHPLPLHIQEELVDEHKDISETSAGEELNREINARIKRHQEGMGVLEEEIEEAIRDGDEGSRRELETEAQRMRREIARFEYDIKRLASDYGDERDRLEARLTQTETEARQEADRVAAQYQRPIDSVTDSLRKGAAASERERAQMAQRINELSRRSGARTGTPTASRGPYSIIQAAADRMLTP